MHPLLYHLFYSPEGRQTHKEIYLAKCNKCPDETTGDSDLDLLKVASESLSGDWEWRKTGSIWQSKEVYVEELGAGLREGLKRGKMDKGEGERAFEMILQNSRPWKGLGFIEGQWEVTEGL